MPESLLPPRQKREVSNRKEPRQLKLPGQEEKSQENSIREVLLLLGRFLLLVVSGIEVEA